MLRTMNHYQNGPTVIRYPRGCGSGVPLPATAEILPIGKAEVLQTGNDVLLVSLGTMIGIARDTATLLEERGYSVIPGQRPVSPSRLTTNASGSMPPAAK